RMRLPCRRTKPRTSRPPRNHPPRNPHSTHPRSTSRTTRPNRRHSPGRHRRRRPRRRARKRQATPRRTTAPSPPSRPGSRCHARCRPPLRAWIQRTSRSATRACRSTEVRRNRRLITPERCGTLTTMLRPAIDRLVVPDPARRALRALARRTRALPKRRKPDDALQVVVDLARGLARGRYAALSVTDSHDRTEGFFTSGLSREQLMRLRTPPQGHGPLGSLRYDGRPVRFDDVSEHAKAFGFPSNHPEMRAMVGVAIWAH